MSRIYLSWQISLGYLDLEIWVINIHLWLINLLLDCSLGQANTTYDSLLDLSEPSQNFGILSNGWIWVKAIYLQESNVDEKPKLQIVFSWEKFTKVIFSWEKFIKGSFSLHRALSVCMGDRGRRAFAISCWGQAAGPIYNYTLICNQTIHFTIRSLFNYILYNQAQYTPLHYRNRSHIQQYTIQTGPPFDYTILSRTTLHLGGWKTSTWWKRAPPPDSGNARK